MRAPGVKAPSVADDHRLKVEDLLYAFEEGSATGEQVLTLFSALVRSGLAWRLPGFYGRAAEALIDAGLLSRTGEML